MGYVVDAIPHRLFLPLGTTTLISLAPPQPPLTSYFDLPEASHADGKCCNCHAYPNRTRTEEFKEGMHAVVVCAKCATKMHPLTRH